MRRVFKALISNGLFSFMSLLLSVIIARSAGTEGLGQFGVAFAAYLLVQLIARDAGANTLSASLPSKQRIRATAGRISLMGIALGLPILAAGLLFGVSYLAVLGIAIHGLCLYDYSKTLSLSIGDGRVALIQDATYFAGFSAAAALAFFGYIDSVGLMSAWAFWGAGLGYVASLVQRFHLMPHWSGDSDELKVSRGFAVQALIGGGSVHVLTFLLTAVGGALVVGAMRGASTMVGPANVITTSLQPLLITYFARTAPRAGAVSMRAVYKSAAGIAFIQLVLVAGLVYIGVVFGDKIFGSTWRDAAPLLITVALDSLFVALGSAPLAAHRSLWAAQRLGRLNLFTVLARIPLVLVGAYLWGAEGAVVAFLIVTVANTAVAWASLMQLHGNGDRPGSAGDPCK